MAMALRPREGPRSMASRCTAHALADGCRIWVTPEGLLASQKYPAAWPRISPIVEDILRILPVSISAFSGRLRSPLAISSLAPQLRCFRQHPRLLVGSVGASGRWREGEFHRLLAAQLRTDQIALVATQPQQQQHLVVDGLGTGLRREAIRLVAFHDRRRDLHDESLAEEVGHVPERIDREGRGLVLRFVLDQEIVCRLRDGFPSLVAGFLFNDLAVTLLQSLALAAFLHDGRAACWRCRWNSCRVACRPLPSAASCDSLEPILGDESEEFQGGSLRTLFTAFPLAHQTRCHVQISGENRLARALPQTKGADFRRLQWLHWCKTQVIEFTHRAFVHYAGGVKTFGRLVNRRHQRTTVLLFHRSVERRGREE